MLLPCLGVGKSPSLVYTIVENALGSGHIVAQLKVIHMGTGRIGTGKSAAKQS